MKPNSYWIILGLLAICASGCRNCNQCWRPNPLAGLGSPTITPPSTGSYQVGNTQDPYYGTTLPTLPASGNTTVPVQPASTLAPGWRPAGTTPNNNMPNPGTPNSTSGGSQVPARPAGFNQTSFNVPNNGLQIPMNNVVSSTQTSLLRPTNSTTAGNSQGSIANNQPRLATNPPANSGTINSGGMPVNDSTGFAQSQSTSSTLGGYRPPATRMIVGSQQYEVRPTPVNPTYQVPYNPAGMYASQPGSNANYGSASNRGWQAPQNVPQQNFNR